MRDVLTPNRAPSLRAPQRRAPILVVFAAVLLPATAFSQMRPPPAVPVPAEDQVDARLLSPVLAGEVDVVGAASFACSAATLALGQTCVFDAAPSTSSRVVAGDLRVLNREAAQRIADGLCREIVSGAPLLKECLSRLKRDVTQTCGIPNMRIVDDTGSFRPEALACYSRLRTSLDVVRSAQVFHATCCACLSECGAASVCENNVLTRPAGAAACRQSCATSCQLAAPGGR